MDLSWARGTLHYGIKDFGSNIRLVWARTSADWANSLLHCLICANLGKNSEKSEQNPQILKNIQVGFSL
jgi:hypothetical protein